MFCKNYEKKVMRMSVLQILYHQTMAGLWKCPAFDLETQAITYVKTNMGQLFICSDLYLMQVVAAHMRPEATLVPALLKSVHLLTCLIIQLYTVRIILLVLLTCDQLLVKKS